MILNRPRPGDELTDGQRVRLALELQALGRQTDPSYAVWLEGGLLRERYGRSGEPTRLFWWEALQRLGMAETSRKMPIPAIPSPAKPVRTGKTPVDTRKLRRSA